MKANTISHTARAAKSPRSKPENNLEIHFAVGQCSLGSVLIARTDKGVCAILLGDDPQALVSDLRSRFPRAV
ncbi:MAG TPA: hypothetical protein VI653_14640, partial [Steroidobacteraceae bacterium]